MEIDPGENLHSSNNRRIKDLMEMDSDTRFTYLCKSILLVMNPYDGLYSSGLIEMKVQMDIEPWIIML